MEYFEIDNRVRDGIRPVVGIRIPAWATFARGIFGGIVRFMRLNRESWQIRYMIESTNEISPVKIDKHWSGDGLIVFRPSVSEVDAWHSRGIPVINLSNVSLDFGAPTIIPDNEVAGCVAANHLSEIGLKTFAYWGDPSRSYSRDRCRSFMQELQKSGHDCVELGLEVSKLPQKNKWKLVQSAIIDQLLPLPKPVGIFARDDIAAVAISLACAQSKYRTPNDVALLGFGNDLIACHTATPPLSSIAYPGDKIGYEAALSLSNLMAGSKHVSKLTKISPGKLVTRESTDFLAFGDELIADAIRMIRKEAPKCMIRVSDLINRLPISRADFQKRFREALGRTPKGEITRVRIERLQQLLSDTDWSVKEIAFEMGFESSEELSRFCRRKLSLSATEFRQQKGR